MIAITTVTANVTVTVYLKASLTWSYLPIPILAEHTATMADDMAWVIIRSMLTSLHEDPNRPSMSVPQQLMTIAYTNRLNRYVTASSRD